MTIDAVMLLEEQLVGALVATPNQMHDAARILPDAEGFISGKFRAIYQAMLDYWSIHGTYDIPVIYNLLSERGHGDLVDGEHGLVDLYASVYTPNMIEKYATELERKIRSRRLAATGHEIQAMAESGEDIDLMVDQAEAMVYAISDQRPSDHRCTMAQAIDDELKEIRAGNRGRKRVKSGFPSLDDKTNGFTGGQLIILAARPSMGKTAMALCLADRVLGQGHGIIFYSLEMNRSDIARRNMCSNAGISMRQCVEGHFSDTDNQNLDKLSQGYQKAKPYVLHDPSGISMARMRSQCRRDCASYDISAIFIDFLSCIMPRDTRCSRQEQVAEISGEIKRLARELDVPIVCLCQLNRLSEMREDKRPRMSDLRESGAIEQDADVILMLHREDYDHRHEHDWIDNNETSLIMNKNRNGPTGTMRLRWHPEYMTFTEALG